MDHSYKYKHADNLLDKYRIEKPLGWGAFGEVYLVTHTKLGVQRVVKILRRDTAGVGTQDYNDAQARFLLESQLGARLNSPVANPHLLQVFDNEISEELCLIEMEYASGGSLVERIQKYERAGQPFPIREALTIALEMAEALQVLHALGVVHRDFKPANILFDEQGHARLADFGLAQVTGGSRSRDDLSRPQPHPGTPGYMSPEQEESGKTLRPPSDIYSLGLVLFEMLTGRNYTFEEPGTRARSLRADVSPALDELLSKMLAESPKDRPWNGEKAAALLREELRACNEGVPANQKLTPENPIVKLLPPVHNQPEMPQFQVGKLPETLSPIVDKLLKDTNNHVGKPPEILKPKGFFITLAPGVSMEFVHVPAGEFLMGSDPAKDKQAHPDEQPQHNVILSEYLIGRYPVTNRQYECYVKSIHCKPPSHWENGQALIDKRDHPVTFVSWNDAADFCVWVNRVSRRSVRLPSEAEWEKAARGVDGRIYPWGNQSPDSQRCNFEGNMLGTTHVGRFSSQGDSPFGCADMAGNVWEWVGDWYDPKYYKRSPTKNPTGSGGGSSKVLRGGSWDYIDRAPRCSTRENFIPSVTNYSFGFRCACDLSGLKSDATK